MQQDREQTWLSALQQGSVAAALDTALTLLD